MTGQILTGDPFSREADLVYADVLVRDEHITGVRAVNDLMQQQVCLCNALAGRERPVGTYALALELIAGDDGRVVEAARRDQTPQPCQCRRNDVQHTHDAVVRVVTGGRRHTDAEGAYVYFYRLLDDVRNIPARHDGARVGARLAVGIQRVLPDQQGRARMAFHVEEAQRLLRLGADALVNRVAAVMGYAVHAEEPAVLAVNEHQLAGVVLHARIAGRHIVAYRLDLTGGADVQVGLLARYRVGGEEDLAVRLARDVLKHLALAAARGALVHDDQLVLIRGDQTACGGMAGGPALLLADVEQNRVNALLRGRTRIKVVGKYFVAVVQTVVDNDLLALEMGVTERGRNVDDGARLVALGLLSVDKTLKMCQREGEERALLRADEHRAVAVFVAAGIERHQNELLRLEPFHGLLTQLVELVAVNVSKALFVGRLVVRDAHAVRLTAAHVVLGEVNGCTVLAADNVRFLEQTLAGYIKYNVVHISMLGTEYHVVQLCLAGRHGNALAVFDHVGQFL